MLPMRYSILRPWMWVAFGVVVAGSGAALGAEPQTFRIDADSLVDAQLTLYWRVDLPLRPADRVASLWFVDEHIYALTDSGMLFAVRGESGLVHWQRVIAEPGDVVYPITHAIEHSGLGPVIVTTPGWIALLDRESGREIPFFDRAADCERARLPLEKPAAGPAQGDAETLYVSYSDGRYAALRRKNGIPRWYMGTGTFGSTTPRHIPGRLLFASDKGLFFLFDIEQADRKLIWSDQLGTAPLEPILGLSTAQRKEIWPTAASTTPIEPIHLDGQDLVFAGSDQVVYSIDPATGPIAGRCRWRCKLNTRPVEGPAVVGDLVFQPIPSGGLVAIDRQKGRKRWTLPEGCRLLSRSADTICALSRDGGILVADATTGSPRKLAKISGIVFAPSNLRTDAVYVAGQRGQIACIRPRGTAALTRADLLPVRHTAATTPAASAATPESAADGQPANTATVTESDPLRSRRFQ